MGIFDKLRQGLQKTRDSLGSSISSIFSSSTIDDETFDELLEVLIMADCGVNCSEYLVNTLKDKVKEKKISEPNECINLLEEIIVDFLDGNNEVIIDTEPTMLLIIGVNGAGKTTSIGKLACKYLDEEKQVVLGAADTFRAAAVEQLEQWAIRADVPLIKKEEGSDPASVVYDTIQFSKRIEADVIIIDTAGRLHNKKNLMDELAKIRRIAERELPEKHIEALLVLDATTGQNGVNQAREFAQATGIDGIILTKLDGTAKGGVVLAIKQELGLDVKFVGVGEKIDDLMEFDRKAFAAGLLEM